MRVRHSPTVIPKIWSRACSVESSSEMSPTELLALLVTVLTTLPISMSACDTWGQRTRPGCVITDRFVSIWYSNVQPNSQKYCGQEQQQHQRKSYAQHAEGKRGCESRKSTSDLVVCQAWHRFAWSQLKVQEGRRADDQGVGTAASKTMSHTTDQEQHAFKETPRVV